ncbi:hypothetical protein AMTR_s00128p00058650 [Amborella trichopoda]|uniref:Uncharacterized protein n=1 Tax=Amborella trichopoda TaxID=13333 RepID=W1NPX7_AMBTC|nr:hypothetical protein AMTR_s00128p00058650 [Amborella trichopoda]
MRSRDGPGRVGPTKEEDGTDRTLSSSSLRESRSVTILSKFQHICSKSSAIESSSSTAESCSARREETSSVDDRPSSR